MTGTHKYIQIYIHKYISMSTQPPKNKNKKQWNKNNKSIKEPAEQIPIHVFIKPRTANNSIEGNLDIGSLTSNRLKKYLISFEGLEHHIQCIALELVILKLPWDLCGQIMSQLWNNNESISFTVSTRVFVYDTVSPERNPINLIWKLHWVNFRRYNQYQRQKLHCRLFLYIYSTPGKCTWTAYLPSLGSPLRSLVVVSICRTSIMTWLNTSRLWWRIFDVFAPRNLQD